MIGLDSYSKQIFIYLDPIFYLSQSLNRLPIWNSQNCSMFPLAFVAGWLQGHWWGFISRNRVVWPTFFLMNVFIALKGSHFWFLFYEKNGVSSWGKNIGKSLYVTKRKELTVYAYAIHGLKYSIQEMFDIYRISVLMFRLRGSQIWPSGRNTCILLNIKNAI